MKHLLVLSALFLSSCICAKPRALTTERRVEASPDLVPPKPVEPQCGRQRILREAAERAGAHRYQALPGMAAARDFTLLAVSDDGRGAIATRPRGRDLYLWEKGTFSTVTLASGSTVLCADAKSRVVVYAADAKLIPMEYESSSQAPPPPR